MKFLFLTLLLILPALSIAESSQGGIDIRREHIKTVSIVAPVWEDYSNADGSGLYWDILKAIYQPEGIRLKHKTVPWNRAMKMVSKYHLYNGIIGEYRETEEDLLFPDYPIDVEYLSVVAREGLSFTDMSSLSGKNVGWIKDYDLIPEAQIDFTLKEFRDLDQGLELLRTGALDYLIEEWDELAAAMQTHAMSAERYSVAQLPQGTDVYVAFSNNKLSQELIRIYNERVPQLVKNGTMGAIYQRWDLGEMPDALLQLSD